MAELSATRAQVGALLEQQAALLGLLAAASGLEQSKGEDHHDCVRVCLCVWWGGEGWKIRKRLRWAGAGGSDHTRDLRRLLADSPVDHTHHFPFSAFAPGGASVPSASSASMPLSGTTAPRPATPPLASPRPATVSPASLPSSPSSSASTSSSGRAPQLAEVAALVTAPPPHVASAPL